MSQYNASGHKGYVTDNALAKGLAVKLSAGKVVVATAGTDFIIGVTVAPASAGSVADIRLRSSQGTTLVKAGGTIAIGDAVTATTGGAAITTSTAGNKVIGVALEAGVSGDFIEVLNSTNTL